MATPPAADDALAREWQSLQRKLSHARGFCFIVYFVRDQRLAQALKQRLGDDLQQRQAGVLQAVAVGTPEALVADSLAPLFQPAAAGAPRRVFWLEAFRGAGRPAWDTAREQLLMRLNERRSRLETELQQPLVLLLPTGAQRSAATLAPDLWHIRVHSAELQAGPGAGGSLPTSAPGSSQPGSATGPGQIGARSSSSAAPAVHAGAGAGADEALREVAWWRSQQSATPGADGAVPDISLWDGFAAVMALIDRGRLAEAQGLVDEVVQLATQRWQSAAADERSGAAQRLAEAHMVHSVLAYQQGRFDAAVAASETALQHMRSVIAAQGASPGNVSVLVTQLNQLGNAWLAKDGLAEAGRSFAESLTHARWLAQQADPDGGALDALAITLGNVGEVHRLRGEWDQAAAVFAESLQAVRQALAAGDSAARRRMLSVALFKMAGIALHQGRLDEAASGLQEVLALDRRRLAEDGETPRALDDVAIDLAALAQLEGWPTDRQRAAAAEALQLRQRLVDLFPDDQRFQQALERARQTFDNLQSSDPQSAP